MFKLLKHSILSKQVEAGSAGQKGLYVFLRKIFQLKKSKQRLKVKCSNFPVFSVRKKKQFRDGNKAANQEQKGKKFL